VLGIAIDANGNTLSDPSGKSYSWDFENRLTQAVVPGTNGGTTTFRYDPMGRRIQKSGPLGTTNYLYDGFNLLEEVDSAGNVLAKYTHGAAVDEDLAMLRNGTASYYHQDGLGSITSLSSPTGALANTYTYDAFGRLTASTGNLTNPFQYTGREFDSETGLLFNRARYFDPSAGRFLSQDPIRFRGGMNFYAYVRNNPAVFKDVFGYQGCSAQSPNACAGPTDPDSPYQGPDGLWYNTIEWSPSPPEIMLPWPPSNDESSTDCECSPWKISKRVDDIWEETLAKEEQSVGLGAKVSGVSTAADWILEHVGLGGIAGWISGADSLMLGHDVYDIWDAQREAEEEIRELYDKCGIE
jgi:RHS repeat-associated protein